MTTASVPWLTGTAINPLLRAAHLTAGRPDGAVTLYLPWLEPERQHEVYKDIRFETRGDQARYVAAWVRDTAGMAEAAGKLRIAFYDAHYHTPQGSIYPMGRTVEALPRADFRRYDGGGGAEAGAWAPDVVVLEEPEHLNWYSFVDGDASAWRSQGHVVGVVHTHYVSYAATERACGGLLGELVHPVVGPFKAMMALLMSRWMTNGHCHRVVKLSNTLRVGNDDAEVACNVHGVRGAFLDVGEGRKAEFATHYAFALRHEPPPLSDRMRRRLSWAAATDRFCDAAAMPETPLRRHQRLAEYLHCHMGKGRRGDWIRSIAGAGFTVGRQSKDVRERQGGGDAPPAAADAPVEWA
ncbi:digalactosyldiacylglycerol synthase [Aureococcus anophagefferens]|nr:digalactosyldiacylglycerol synthase [Aureococcus anophagefferens]